jgi:hypothetical protein
VDFARTAITPAVLRRQGAIAIIIALGCTPKDVGTNAGEVILQIAIPSAGVPLSIAIEPTLTLIKTVLVRAGISNDV